MANSSSNWKVAIAVALIGAIATIGAALIKKSETNKSNKSEPVQALKENNINLQKKSIIEIPTINQDSIAESFYSQSLKGEDYILRLDKINEAIKIKNDDSRFLFIKGKLLIKLDKYNEAITYLDSSINFNSNFAPAFDNRGLAKFKLCQEELENKGKCWDAIEDFDMAIRIYEEIEKDEKASSTAYYNKGISFKELGRYCKALDNMKLANKSRRHTIYKNEIELLKPKCRRN